ncbi:MAG: hypothetical protein KDE47_15310 [Caldilineaceae bacterium]|nr:hypothetical protein [Caldilineaceae bacterium]
MLYPSTRLAWQTTPLPPPAPSGASDETVLAHLDRPFTVSVRQWAAVSDTPEQFSLQLSALLSDSRCPAQVNCVVAGQVEFRLLLRTNNVVSPRLFQIGSYPIHDQNKLRYAGYEIELAEVEPPAPPPGQRLNVNDYRVTLVVRRDTTVGPTPSATSAPTATPTPQSQPHGSETLRLGQPFTMRVGETTSLDDIDFQLTLRSISDDSGCLTATDCSVMTADGTLILQQGTQREILTFMASITPEQPFDYDFAGYVVRLLHLEVGRDGKAVATFVVARPMAAAAIPDPEWITTCPHFSSFDAAAILQEEVEPRAIANLVFGPIAPDAETVTGFCGYLAAANDQTAATAPTTAHIVSDVNAARGVVATIVEGDDSAQLLQLAQLLAADTNGTPAARYQLQAMLMAGDYEGVIGTLRDLAAENEAASSSSMIDVGDEGMWFWQPVADGYFAMLVAREEEPFAVVVALLNRDADEEFVRDHMIVAARYLE